MRVWIQLRSAVFFVLCFPAIAAAADWPHWRGPARNDVTLEQSGWELSQLWPPGDALWSANVGPGASAPLVIDDRVYTIGWADGQDVIRCLDAASGDVLWEQRYDAPEYGRRATGDQGFYRGATATPEFDLDSKLLFTLGCDGRLSAWDTRKEGEPVWSLNLYERFDIPRRPQITKRPNTQRDYGYTTAPLVFGDWVLVEAGDPERGAVMAFPKRTGGEPVWTSENRDPAGHSGGIVPLVVEGVACAAVATSRNVLVLRLDGEHAGKTAAEFPWETDFSNTIPTLSVQGQDLLVSSRYNQMAMVRMSISLKVGAREVWRNRYPTGVCSPIIHEGHIYFANHGVHCVDFESGQLVWEGGKFGDAGSCILMGDGRLIVWGNDGDLALVEGAARSPKSFHLLAEKRGVLHDMAWPHVVAAQGRLLCKTLNGDLVCFRLSR